MSGRKYFLFLKDGAFVERENESVLTRCSFNSVTGFLVNITFKDIATGKIMKLHIVDEDNFYMISMFLSSRPAYAFLMLLGSLQIGHPFTLNVERVDGKDLIKAYQFNSTMHLPWKIEYAGFSQLLIHEKVAILLDRLHNQILPALQKAANPYPSHMFYKPSIKGLAGGYFDDYKSGGRVIGPMSTEERNDPYFGMR